MCLTYSVCQTIKYTAKKKCCLNRFTLSTNHKSLFLIKQVVNTSKDILNKAHMHAHYIGV